MLKNIVSIFKGKKDLYIYMFSKIFVSILSAIVSILIARYFSKQDYGLFKTIVTYIGFISIFINFGLNDYFLIKFSKTKNIHLLRKILENFSFLYITILPVAIIFYIILYSEGIDLMLIMYISIIFGNISGIINIIFQAYNKFNLISLISIINTFIFLFVVISFIYFLKGSLFYYFFLLLILSVINFTISLIFYSKYKSIKSVFFFPSLNLKILKLAFPFFISGLTSFLYMQSDILLLSIFKNITEVARYTIPLTFITFGYLFPSVLYNYFIPKLSYSFQKKFFFKTYLKNFLLLNTIFSLPLFLILFLFSSNLLTLFFTEKYTDSANILKLLSIVFIFHSFCFITGAILTASNNQNIRSKIQLAGAIFNVILNIIFIPIYGAEGAAFTTALTEIIIFIFYYYYSKMYIT